MIWHDLKDPKDPELDRLAVLHKLHPLHIEDCRDANQRAKIEEGNDYLFMILKPLHVDEQAEVKETDLDIFLGQDYVISIQHLECKTVRARLDHLHTVQPPPRADQIFYRIFDGVVDEYLPPLDHFSDVIDEIEDQVLEKPTPEMLERIFKTKRALIGMRRVLANTRDTAGHLQRTQTHLVNDDLIPFFRDVYDHLARDLDMVESERDILTGVMDIYLSSVANRTNQVMKVLTILGTIALPSIVISGIYGMNVKGIPWLADPHGMEIVSGLMIASTVILLVILKKFDWF